MTEVDLSAITFDDDGEIVWPMQLLDIEPLTVETFDKEKDVNTAGPGHNLRDYWTRGKGAAKIRWKTPGDFTRCVANLRDKVTRPEGLCAEYHKRATGMWPGDKRNPGMKKHDGETVTLDGETLTFAVDDKGNVVADDAAPAEMAVDDEGNWHGTLTVEDMETGDGRLFKANSLSWAEFPLPLRYTPVDVGAHQGAHIVGNIDGIERRAGGRIFGWGTFDLDPANEMAHKAYGEMKRGYLRGNSVDVDSVKAADVELVFDFDDKNDNPSQPSLTIFHKGRIRATTLVQIPAFAEATLQLGKESMPDTVVASAAVDEPWNSHEELTALIASAGGKLPREMALSAFAWVPEGDEVRAQDCRFMHHTMTDEGEVSAEANLTACAASIQVLNDRTELPGNLRRSAYNHLKAHIEAAGMVAPELVESELVAAAAPLITADDCPPSEWFRNPELSNPTPITITADGRLYGHGALWRSCHTGFGDVCVAPPKEGTHDYFRLGEVLCADGSRVACGTITLGTGHAPTVGMSARGAIEHYDHTGSAVADVVSGEDEHGIWVAGAVRPGLTASSVRELMGAKLSGDWRKIQGKLRLVAMLAVNVPGFGVPRLQAGVQDGHQLSLVASGIVPTEAELIAARNQAAIAEMKLKLQKDVGLDIDSKKAALVASIRGE